MLLWTSSLILFVLGSGKAHHHRCHGHGNEEWNYNDQGMWKQRYPACNGTKQSPVNIRTNQVIEDKGLWIGFINYNVSISSANVTNNGHTILITPTDGEVRGIEGSGLPQGCEVRQCHWHWGRALRGSEHRINGRSYPAELHIVHQCRGSDRSKRAATGDETSQLAVTATFFRETDENNPALAPLLKSVRDVRHKGQQTSIQSPIKLSDWIPKNTRNFYRYHGSLTTPPCSENVIWTVFQEPCRIGNPQLERFRDVYSTKSTDEEQCKMVNNFRSRQDLFGRNVTSLMEDYRR